MYPRGALAEFHARFEWTLIAGLVLAMLIHAYFVFRFAWPALRSRKRKLFLAGIIAAFVLFVAAVIVAYTWILPAVMARGEEPPSHSSSIVDRVHWGWEDYRSVATWICFGFGQLCELPIVATLLGLFGLVGGPWLSSTRPHGYVIVLVLSAINAPTRDPITFVVLSVPLLLLYEGCIRLVWLIDRRRKRRAEGKTKDLSD